MEQEDKCLFISVAFTFFTYRANFGRQQASKSHHPSALPVSEPLHVVASSPHDQSKGNLEKSIMDGGGDG